MEVEILHEQRFFKRNKASDPDELPPGLFKDGGPVLLRSLHTLQQIVRITEIIPAVSKLLVNQLDYYRVKTVDSDSAP